MIKWYFFGIFVLLLTSSVNAAVSDLNPEASFRFLQNNQNIEENKFNQLKDIYFYLSVHDETGKLDDIPEKQFFVDKIQSFQNADGGFGDWYRDRSKAKSSRLALLSLSILDAEPINKTALRNFLYNLQVMNLTYGNYGFKSSLKDTDADLSSTYDVIFALDMLNFDVPNHDDVILYLKDHQNVDGGFGLQTNRESGIIWTSTLTHTRRGLKALQLMDASPDFIEEAKRFVHSMQAVEGGYANSQGEKPKISSTYNALLSLKLLDENIHNEKGIENFIRNNEGSNGGFHEYTGDTKEGIHTSYYAITSMSMLNNKLDNNKIISYLNTHLNSKIDGGFSNYPGLESTLRSTFNAVSALNLIGNEPLNKTLTIEFIQTFKNDDGGYGHNGFSNVESTYRAVLALNILGKQVNRDQIIQYIRNTQNNDGGFGFEHGATSRVSYTYRAIRALDILGSQPANKAGTISFLQSAQNIDGGFANNLGDRDSGIGSTYRALRALFILESSAKDSINALQFIKNSKNTDGGYLDSPTSIYSIGNVSKSVFTYDAVLGAYALNSTISDPLTLEYIKNLRNPDLAFSKVLDFTSDVSSTFTSLWTYYYLNDAINYAPELKFSKVEHQLDEATIEYVFSTRVYDNNSQSPEYVHLILNNQRYLMNIETDSLKGEKYVYSLILPIGDYDYHFETFDGMSVVSSKTKHFNVRQLGDIPEIKSSVSWSEGTVDTLFIFVASINSSNITSVSIQFDEGLWLDMNESNNTYTYEASFNPGLHQFKIKTYDGVNIVKTQSSTITVHTTDVDKPSWEIYIKISQLIYDNFNTSINYNDVNKEIVKGAIYWKVQVNQEDILIDYSGDSLYESKQSNDTSAIIIIILIISVLLIIIFKKKVFSWIKSP